MIVYAKIYYTEFSFYTQFTIKNNRNTKTW